MNRGRIFFQVLAIAGLLCGWMTSTLHAQTTSTNAPDLSAQNYQAALDAGQRAFAVKDYAGAIAHAVTALSGRPGDAVAMKLKDDAQVRLREIAAQAESDKLYASAMRAGQEALAQKKFSAALTHVEQALTLKPIDAKAILLRDDVRGEMLKANAAREREEKLAQSYQAAMLKVRKAFDVQEYTNAVTWAEAALKIKPDDADALELRTRALSKVKGPDERVARLDEQLEVLLVTFNVKVKDVRSEAARSAKRLTIAPGNLSMEMADQYLKQIDDLQRQWRALGMLTLENRQRKLDELRTAIKNW